MTVQERLFELSDKEYAVFQAKLAPTVSPETFIGVRVPAVRALAKQLIKENCYSGFLSELPHRYFDENMLHAVLISEIRDYDAAVRETDRFLPFVDNWAVCDVLSPRAFRKHRSALLEKISEWSASEHEYTCRFGIEMLMSHFLDGDFRPEYLEIPARVHSGKYYVRMMVAWFFATALAKQWDAAVPYIETGRLDPWVHNKTIQKARESFRITDSQKEYLKSLKI